MRHRTTLSSDREFWEDLAAEDARLEQAYRNFHARERRERKWQRLKALGRGILFAAAWVGTWLLVIAALYAFIAGVLAL